jgi:hypothetical protein
MNHNPNNVEIGQWVVLDDNEDAIVLIFSMTPNKMFSEVGNLKTDTWSVMTDRLKPQK